MSALREMGEWLRELGSVDGDAELVSLACEAGSLSFGVPVGAPCLVVVVGLERLSLLMIGDRGAEMAEGVLSRGMSRRAVLRFCKVAGFELRAEDVRDLVATVAEGRAGGVALQ